MRRSLLTLALFVGLFCAACGGSPSPSPSLPNSNPSSNAGSPSASKPTVLHVTRTDLSPTHSMGPLDKTVSDAQLVQRLYSTALALPSFSAGQEVSQACLNDPGLVYHLDFLQGSADVQKMNLDPGNCKLLYFSQSDIRQVNDAFLTLFKQSIQVGSLTWSSFHPKEDMQELLGPPVDFSLLLIYTRSYERTKCFIYRTA